MCHPPQYFEIGWCGASDFLHLFREVLNSYSGSVFYGYYLGNQLGEWSGTYGSKATNEKNYIGFVNNYYNQINVAEFKLEAGEIEQGDKILITGNATGVVETIADGLMANYIKVEYAKKGDIITLKLDNKVRKNDKLYVIKKKIG